MHKSDTSTVTTTHGTITETEYYIQIPLHKGEYHSADKNVAGTRQNDHFHTREGTA